MESSLKEFLEKKGAIGMLALLHERPMTYSEIEPEIEVTSDTIIERRDEAAELGLLNISLGEAESGTKRVYHLTDMGEALADEMARQGLVSNYRKMRTLEQLVDEQKEELIKWVLRNPSQLLQFTEADQNVVPVDASSEAETGDSNDTRGGNDARVEPEGTGTQSDESGEDDRVRKVVPGDEDQAETDENSAKTQGTLSDIAEADGDNTDTQSE